MARRKRQDLSAGTYAVADTGIATPIRLAKKRSNKTPNLTNLVPGYYAVDQHQNVISGPLGTKDAAVKAGNRSDTSYAVMHVAKKGKKSGKR